MRTIFIKVVNCLLFEEERPRNMEASEDRKDESHILGQAEVTRPILCFYFRSW